MRQPLNRLLEDPIYRAKILAPMVLGQTAHTSTTHVGANALGEIKSLCGRVLRFGISSDAGSQHEFDSRVTCFTCQRNLISRRRAQRAIRNYDQRVVGFEAPGHRSRLSPLAAARS